MSATNTPPVAFQPAFCHRGDCKADPNDPFCAGCGADIAAYLQATGSFDTVSEDTADSQPTAVMNATAPLKIFKTPGSSTSSSGSGASTSTAGASAGSEAAVDTATGWRATLTDRVVLIAFAAAVLSGAGAAVAAGMI